MGTVSKAMSLLNAFTLTQSQIGLSDLARLTGLNKATAHRLLSELQAQGLVEQVDDSRAYRLGPGLLRLAMVREATVPLLASSREAVRRLCDQTDETAHMSVLRGARLWALTHAYSPTHATRVMMEDTAELPFHATASGLAVLAFAPTDLLDAALSGPLPSFTEQTATDANCIRALLPAIRRDGFANSCAGVEDEVLSCAAPVFGPDQTPIGAIAVAAPATRMSAANSDGIREHVMTTAQDLTQQIGGLPPPPASQQT